MSVKEGYAVKTGYFIILACLAWNSCR